MTLGADLVPDSFDLSVGTDEKRTAHDAEEGFAEEFFHAARAVGFNGLELGIAEKIEINFELGFEAGLSFDGIRARAENHRTQFVELLLCVAKLGRFNGSTGSVGLRIEVEDHTFAEKVRKRDFFAMVILQAKVRRFVTYFEHERTSTMQLESHKIPQA